MNKIRPTAFALISKDNKFLVIDAYDKIKKEKFFRPLGGGIEFRETGKETLKRELLEEIEAEIGNVKFLGLMENIFTYEGKNRHELALLYQADFKDKSFYERKELKILDNNKSEKVCWVDKEELLNSNFYPEGIKRYL